MTVEVPSTEALTHVAMFARDGDGFVVFSDHPAIPTTRGEHQPTLERKVLAVARANPGPIELRWANGLDPSYVFDGDPEDLLAADKPGSAYKTVPGTERLPAAFDKQEGDGIRAQEDDSAAESVRGSSRGRMRVVALGQVHAPNKR